MQAEKKPKEYDVVITMSSNEAKILHDAFAEKSEADDEEYYKSSEVPHVIYELYKALDEV